MKHCYFLLILIFAFTKGFSKSVNGYIVTLTSDTIFVKIKLPGTFGGYNMNKKVEIIDSSGEDKILTPNDIKWYGYTNKSKDYLYRVKIIKDGSLYFLEPIVVGQKASLYEYYVTTVVINNSSTQEFYTFEKFDGTYLFMTNYAALETFREKLKLFYKENLEIQKLIDTKFNARRHIQRDIKEVLEAINKS